MRSNNNNNKKPKERPKKKWVNSLAFDCHFEYASIRVTWAAEWPCLRQNTFSTSDSNHKTLVFCVLLCGSPFRCWLFPYHTAAWKCTHSYKIHQMIWFFRVMFVCRYSQTCRLCINQWHVQHLIDLLNYIHKPRKSIIKHFEIIFSDRKNHFPWPLGFLDGVFVVVNVPFSSIIYLFIFIYTHLITWIKLENVQK